MGQTSLDISESQNRQIAWVARFLMPFSWVGVDVYIPAITQVGEVFGTPVPLSISLYTLGLGVGQLLFGPLSDLWGRKTIAIAGMLLFSLFSFLSLFTHNVDTFLALRALQGFAASAAFVCADAAIRDRFSGYAAIREYSFIQAAGNVIPVVAIPFGTFLLMLYGWKGCFVFLGFSGLAMATYVMYFMPETVSNQQQVMVESSTKAMNPLRNLPFLGFVFCCCAVFSIIMTYVTLAPYELMTRLSLSAWSYGLITSGNALVMGLSALIFAKIARSSGAFGALWVALTFLALGGIGLTLSREWLDVLSFIVFSGFIGIGFGGFLGPASSLAMQPFSENKGKAAAILGAGQLLGAALVTALISHFGFISRLSLGVVTILFTGLCGLICAGLIRHFGRDYLQNSTKETTSLYEVPINEMLVEKVKGI